MESEGRSRREVSSRVVVTGVSGGVGRATAHAFAPSTNGLFDRRSRSRSHQLWATTHRPLAYGTPAAAAAGLGGLLGVARRWG